jgi:hypothetical protein
VQLQSVLEPESWLDWVLLINDMMIQPVILYVFLVFGEFPKLFTLLSAGYRFIETWRKWIRYQVLRGHAREWVFVAKLFGGPFISCNDPKYHVYVYAEAMERLRLGLSRRGWSSTPHHLSRVAAAEKRLETGKHL